MPSHKLRHPKVARATGADGSVYCAVSCFFAVSHTSSVESVVVSTSVVLYIASAVAATAFDCGRTVVVPDGKSISVMPRNVHTAAVVLKSASPAVARPGTLTVEAIAVELALSRATDVVPSLRSSAKAMPVPPRAMNCGARLITICFGVGEASAKLAVQSVLSSSRKYPIVPVTTACRTGDGNVAVPMGGDGVPDSPTAHNAADLADEVTRKPPSKSWSTLARPLSHDLASVSAPNGAMAYSTRPVARANHAWVTDVATELVAAAV